MTSRFLGTHDHFAMQEQSDTFLSEFLFSLFTFYPVFPSLISIQAILWRLQVVRQRVGSKPYVTLPAIRQSPCQASEYIDHEVRDDFTLVKIELLSALKPMKR